MRSELYVLTVYCTVYYIEKKIVFDQLSTEGEGDYRLEITSHNHEENVTLFLPLGLVTIRKPRRVKCVVVKRAS